jgi:hypothetical protein
VVESAIDPALTKLKKVARDGSRSKQHAREDRFCRPRIICTLASLLRLVSYARGLAVRRTVRVVLRLRCRLSLDLTCAKEAPPRACGDTANGSGSARNCTSSSHRSTIAGVTASERRRTRKCGRGTVPRCCRAGEPQGELEGGRDAKSCRRWQVGT